MNFIADYLFVGVCIYLVFFIRDAYEGFPRFKNADFISVVRGLTVIIIWPYILWHMEIKK